MPNTSSNPAPVFVVGSPRSGTSILTWCLGQHSNLLPLEESAWMGDFAADVGVRHLAGSGRGERSQLASMGISRANFLAEIGGAIDRIILAHRLAYESASARGGVWREADPADAAFCLRRAADDRKTRWVDGTPEYSLHICGLHHLFPRAKFVHIVRDVETVVASMLNFDRIGGYELAADASQAYEYWQRTVSACMLAERALGSQVVHRLRYADLIERPERTLREILGFLGERFEPACVEPLLKRINSSSVPADFRIAVANVDPGLLRRVAGLSASLQTPSPACEPAASALAQFEAAFDARVNFVAGLHDELDERTRWARHLDRLLSGYGILQIVQFLAFVIAAAVAEPDFLLLRSPKVWFCFAFSLLGAGAFLWMRRGRLRQFASGFVDRLPRSAERAGGAEAQGIASSPPNRHASPIQ